MANLSHGIGFVAILELISPITGMSFGISSQGKVS
jgi:hypothetical protein